MVVLRHNYHSLMRNLQRYAILGRDVCDIHAVLFGFENSHNDIIKIHII